MTIGQPTAFAGGGRRGNAPDEVFELQGPSADNAKEMDMENQNDMTGTETESCRAVSALIKAEHGKMFAGKMVASVIGYLVVTLFLNWIRASASLWIVWPLILIQLGLYVSIFFSGCRFFTTLGINATLTLVVFVALAALGRVVYLFAWEWVAIPLALAIVVALLFVRLGRYL